MGAVVVDEESGRVTLTASPDARLPAPPPSGGRGPSHGPGGFIFYELNQTLSEEEVSFRRW